MDRIAVVSDIHGNMPAYEAVAEDIQSRGIKRVFCLGDLIGKGPEPKEAIALTKELCEAAVYGNWDHWLSHQPGELQDHGLWQLERLAVEDLDYLRKLPFSLDFWMSGRQVRLFHASAQSVYKRVQPYDSFEDRFSMFDNSGATGYSGNPDVVGYGDIHNAYIQHLKGKMLFNAGSVGNSLDVPLASYVILEGEYGAKEESGFGIQFVRVPYDKEAAIAKADKLDMPLTSEYAREIRTAVYRGKSG